MQLQPYGYLLVLGGCLLVTLPLEVVLGARVYRRPRRLARVLVPVLLVFTAWDVVAIGHDTWAYDPARVCGVVLPLRLPLEEVLFFLVIPVCTLLTFEGLGVVGRAARRWREGRGSGDA